MVLAWYFCSRNKKPQLMAEAPHQHHFLCCSAPPFMVYLRLHNGIGAYNITAEIHDQETQGIMGKSAGKTCSFPDRQTVLNIRFRVPSPILPHAGSYDVVAFADENEIDRYRFTLDVL
jgi:hypothetical protein